MCNVAVTVKGLEEVLEDHLIDAEQVRKGREQMGCHADARLWQGHKAAVAECLEMARHGADEDTVYGHAQNSWLSCLRRAADIRVQNGGSWRGMLYQSGLAEGYRWVVFRSPTWRAGFEDKAREENNA